MIGCYSHEPWCVLNRCGEAAFASCSVEITRQADCGAGGGQDV